MVMLGAGGVDVKFVGRSGAKVLVCDWLVAVGAQAAWPDPTTEAVAVLAASGPEVSLLTRWAFVHGGVGLGDGRLGVGRALSVPSTPVGLFAGVGAETPTTRSGERRVAPRAGGHDLIVTVS